MSQLLPDIAFFHELARLASQETLPRFRSLTANQIETKPKEGFRFDPVTEADREAERVIREHITRHYPEHAIMGEEFGLSGEGPVRWVLDRLMAPDLSCVGYPCGERLSVCCTMNVP